MKTREARWVDPMFDSPTTESQYREQYAARHGDPDADMGDDVGEVLVLVFDDDKFTIWEEQNGQEGNRTGSKTTSQEQTQDSS